MSDQGRKALSGIDTTVELTDFTYHYLKSMIGQKQLFKDDILYRVAFVLADAVAGSNRPYAGKEALLNAASHPFIAYFERLSRPLSPKSLCFELLLILFGAVDPFSAAEWIYDTSRQGYSEDEYKQIALEHGIDFETVLRRDYAGTEDVRLIMCEIIWLIGKDEFFEIVG